jgi:hypothetical protein
MGLVRTWGSVLVCGCATACGGDAAGGGGDETSADEGDSAGPATIASADDDDDDDDGDATSVVDTGDESDDEGTTDTGEPECEPFGKWPAPEDTFTLPATAGEGIYYVDVQASFPEVDWAGVDRLYIPAGQYLSMQLGNLPERTADDPLVITNLGGQVRIGPNDPAGNYLWVMSGGSHWVITGRWDPEAATGDESAPGHRCGDYEGSRGAYGFWSDDAFAQREYLHMGLSVGDATAFEIEFVEIERSGFAGIRLLNAWVDGAPQPMADVEVHDTYVHDVDGEGIYFGWTGAPPGNLQPGMRVHDNRFVRTGNEALQVQDLGPGSEIHNNVIAFAALHWRDNGLGMYQDGNAQIVVRSGEVSIHHNVFVGGAGTLVSFWSQPQDGDGARMVSFANNYIAEARNLAVYFGGSSEADSSFEFTDNVITGLEFGYDELDPDAVAPTSVFRLGADIGGMVSFTGNRWDADLDLVAGGVVVDEGNVQGAVDALEFVASGYPDGESMLRLEAWTAVSTLSPGMPARVYVPGDLVMHDATMYRALVEGSDLLPPEHPEAWEALPDPLDDLRALPPYDDLGIQ